MCTLIPAFGSMYLARFTRQVPFGVCDEVCSQLLRRCLGVQVSGNLTAAATQKVDPSMVDFNSAASSLTLKGLNQTLTCGQDLTLSWSGND